MEKGFRVKNRYPLSKKERKKLFSEVKVFGTIAGKHSLVEKAVILSNKREYVVLILDGDPVFVLRGDEPASAEPLLCALINKRRELVNMYPNITVDRGATRAIARGANLMIPGITGVRGEFNEGSIVVVLDEESRAPVAVGRAALSSEELKAKLQERARGLAVRITQRPGDELWRICEYIK